MRRFSFFVSILISIAFSALTLFFLTGCGDLADTYDTAVSDIKAEARRLDIKVSSAYQKAVQDIEDEEARTTNRVKKALKKANMDTLDEEARTTGRVKDTLKKANMDTLDEEARTTGRVKDTLKKANMDTLDEAKDFNDNFNDEKARTTDKLVGDDGSKHAEIDDTLVDYEKKLATLEALVTLNKTSITALYSLIDTMATSKDLAKLMITVGQLTDEVDALLSLEGNLEGLGDLANNLTDIILELFDAGNLDDLIGEIADLLENLNAQLIVINEENCFIEYGESTRHEISIGGGENSSSDRLVGYKADVILTCEGEDSITLLEDVLFATDPNPQNPE